VELVDTPQKLGDVVLDEDNLDTMRQETLEWEYYQDYDPDPWNDPDWTPPCDCWCELCGCHGYCMDDEDYDIEEDYDD
jgi:hypothetical protein